MDLYVKVSFWILVVGQTIRLLELGLRDHWPHEKKETLGMHLLGIFIGTGFLVWAGYLVWFRG